MRVLVIGPSPTRSKGGMATVIEEIKEDAWLNSKFDIDIFESYVDGSTIKRYFFSIWAYLYFILIYKKYDLFYIHMASYGSTFRKGYYIRFLKKRNKKIILHIHGAEYLLFYNKLSKKRKAIVNDIWAKSDLVIALSEQWKEKFGEIFKNSNIIVIHNGIDTEQYKCALCDITKYQNHFLFLGRLGKRKGAYDIIKAVYVIRDNYPQIKVYMAGDGEICKVKEEIEKAGLDEQIKVVGWVDFNKKIELLKKSSTVLLPSYNEGLPMTILEGMAAGKVIISTEVGGIPEVVKSGENGILIKPGDIDSLSNAICKVMDDNSFIQICSKNNTCKINRTYSMKIMHEKIAEAFILVVS